MAVTKMGDRLKVVRSPQQVTKEKINQTLDRIHNDNQEEAIAGIAYVILMRDGREHQLGVVGDVNLNPLDMLSLVELQRHSILAEIAHDDTEGSA